MNTPLKKIYPYACMFMLILSFTHCSDHEVKPQQDSPTEDPMEEPEEPENLFPKVVGFISNEITINEASEETYTIEIKLHQPTPVSGNITVLVNDFNTLYNQIYTTDPIAEHNVIQLPVNIHDDRVSFTLKTIDNNRYKLHPAFSFKIHTTPNGLVNSDHIEFQVLIHDDELATKLHTYTYSDGVASRKETYIYDETGNVIQTNWESFTIMKTVGTATHQYNAIGQLMKTTYSDNHVLSYQYHNHLNSYLDNIINNSCESFYQFQYNENKFIISHNYYVKVSANGYTINTSKTYEYNDEDKLYIERLYNYTNGKNLQSTRTYTYEHNLINPLPLVTTLFKNPSTQYLPSTVFIENADGSINQEISEYEFDEEDRPIKRIVTTNNKTEVYTYTYFPK
jgi:hypothetical protein